MTTKKDAYAVAEITNILKLSCEEVDGSSFNNKAQVEHITKVAAAALPKLKPFFKNELETKLRNEVTVNEELAAQLEATKSSAMGREEKINELENKNLSLINDYNSQYSNYEQALEANKRLHNDLVRKDKQVDKLISVLCANFNGRGGHNVGDTDS